MPDAGIAGTHPRGVAGGRPAEHHTRDNRALVAEPPTAERGTTLPAASQRRDPVAEPRFDPLSGPPVQGG